MLIISGNNFNLREVCRGKRVTIAAILIHKGSKVSLPRDTGCHCRWEQGENAYHPYITFIWLCICKPWGNSLYATERVFDNSEDQTGRKKAEHLSAEGRAVHAGPCWCSMVWAPLASLAPALLTSPIQLPHLWPREPPLWGSHNLMLWSLGDQMRRTHFWGLVRCKPWTSKTQVSFSSVWWEAGNASSTLTVLCFSPSLFSFLMNTLWITQFRSCWRLTNFHIPAALYDVLHIRLTHLIAISQD